MKLLERFILKIRPSFEKGGRWHRYYYAYEALETFLFLPPHTAPIRGTHIRDAMDMKRMMFTVIVAMLPCLFFGMWNVGHQHYAAVGELATFWEKFLIGSRVVLPIVAVSYAAGLGVEFIFSTIKRHSVNEGFLVSGLLIPLVMPPTIPLWQVALATIFSVLLCKEIFGGTGMNIFNIALMARAFLYFAYPSDISGDEVWVYLGEQGTLVDGYSGATALSVASSTVGQPASADVLTLFATHGWQEGLFSLYNLFLGAIPGSVGETSTLMCLIGAVILVYTGVGSGKIIVSVFAGAYVMGAIFNVVGLNAFMLLPPHYHWVTGGLAFGAVYMATDPVTAAQTEAAKWWYGFFIGVITVLVRVFNPAYPEGIMLAILLMNVFSSLMDHMVVLGNKRRRKRRAAI